MEQYISIRVFLVCMDKCRTLLIYMNLCLLGGGLAYAEDLVGADEDVSQYGLGKIGWWLYVGGKRDERADQASLLAFFLFVVFYIFSKHGGVCHKEQHA